MQVEGDCSAGILLHVYSQARQESGCSLKAGLFSEMNSNDMRMLTSCLEGNHGKIQGNNFSINTVVKQWNREPLEVLKSLFQNWMGRSTEQGALAVSCPCFEQGPETDDLCRSLNTKLC